MQQISQQLFRELLPFKKNPSEQQVLSYVQEKLPEISNITTLQAFTHASFAHEINDELVNYERLEFLGDSVLQLVVTEKIFLENPQAPEGEMSRLRSHLVNEQALADLARKAGLGRMILLGRGELQSEGFEKNSILANVFEAYLGALYLTQGESKTRDFILDCYQDMTDFTLASLPDSDPKSRLQELCHQVLGATPIYKVNQTNEQEFHIKCFAKDKLLGELTTGPSKKEGMKKLAQMILDKEFTHATN